MIIHLSRGRWLVDRRIDRLALPELAGFELSAASDARIATAEFRAASSGSD